MCLVDRDDTGARAAAMVQEAFGHLHRHFEPLHIGGERAAQIMQNPIRDTHRLLDLEFDEVEADNRPACGGGEHPVATIEPGQALQDVDRHLRQWRNLPDFQQAVARAREAAADIFADEIIDIADNSANDWKEQETQSGRIVRVVDQEIVQRSRLRVDARLRLMKKFAPDKYGQRQQITGANGTPLFERLSRMSEEERYREAEALIAQARRRLEIDALARGEVSEAEYVETAPTDDDADSRKSS
jgi:hypothetical protein